MTTSRLVVIRGADQKPVNLSGYMDNAPAEKLRPNTTHHGMHTYPNSPQTGCCACRHAEEHPFRAMMTILAHNRDVKELMPVLSHAVLIVFDLSADIVSQTDKSRAKCASIYTTIIEDSSMATASELPTI